MGAGQFFGMYTGHDPQADAAYKDPNAPATYMGPDGVPHIVRGGSLGERDSALQDNNSTSANRFQYGGSYEAADADVAKFRQDASNFENRQGVQADFANAQAARQQQAEAAGMYRDAAMGKGPSVADAQFAQYLNQQQQAQASAAASARGGGLARAAALRQSLNNSAAMGQNSSAAMAALRAQEIEQARAGYAGVSGQMRGADYQQAMGQAGLDEAQRTRNDQMYQNAMAMGQGVRAAQQQGGQAQEQSINQTNATAAGVGSSSAATGQARDAANMQTATAIGSGVLAAGSSLAALSDRNAKTGISDANSKTQAFLEALKPRDYEYKPAARAAGAAPGRHTSVMAQDLEKSELGRRMVHETPAGKAVDYKEGFATMLASMASMNKRIDALQASLGKGK